MKIILDLQSTQTASRLRGTGRFSLSLAKAMISEGKEHDYLVILNQAFPEQVDATRQELASFLPLEHVLVFRTPTGLIGQPSNEWRCQTAEVVREYFLSQLHPDFVYVSSVFEGLIDEAITSIGRFADLPTAATLYDVTPLHYPDQILPVPIVRSWYMRKLNDLRKARVLFSISEYSRRDAIEMLSLRPENVVNISADADRRFKISEIPLEASLKLRARFGITRDFIMYTAAAFNFHKNIQGLVEAYARLPVEIRTSHQLVICCKLQEGEHALLLELVSRFGLLKNEVLFPGYMADEDLVALYNICKLFVFPSLAEGFGLPVLEAMRCGALVIGSNSTSIPEVIGFESALFDPTSVESISKKLYQAITDEGFREKLRDHGHIQSSKFSWASSAKKVIEALDSIHGQSFRSIYSQKKEIFQSVQENSEKLSQSIKLVKAIKDIPAVIPPSDQELLRLALAISESTVSHDQRQILLYIGDLTKNNNGSGIPRVVQNILQQFLSCPPAGYRVEPVYQLNGQICYARNTGLRDSTPSSVEEEASVDIYPGDIFLVLYLDINIFNSINIWLRHQILRGLKTYYLVYDLLPLQNSNWFPDELCSGFGQWLENVTTTADGLVCISKSIVTELEEWLDKHPIKRSRPLPIGYFHLGSDIETRLSSNGISKNNEGLIKQISQGTSLLMVAILWPRKGHAQILDAMDKLWNQGYDIKLIIVGRQGWSVENLVRRIRSHREFGKRLIWLNDATDEMLLKLYDLTSALVVPSEGEGFGIPVVEAACHGLPIIARDLPVFREIAGDNAYYFNGRDSDSLAKSIQEWLELYRLGKHPRSEGIRCLTWEESANQLKNVLFNPDWLTIWDPKRHVLEKL